MTLKFDICHHFHGMNDFGFADKETREKTGQLYGKTYTYNGECYAMMKGEKCKRKGICVRIDHIRSSEEDLDRLLK